MDEYYEDNFLPSDDEEAENFMEHMFSKDELELLENVYVDTLNIDQLSKTGTVTEEYIEQGDGFITAKLTYKPFKGEGGFIQSRTFRREDKLLDRLQQIDYQLNFCVQAENYEQAAVLKLEYETVLAQIENAKAP